jgi:hypothetical protein
MKPIQIKISGKKWNARIVAGMTQDAFINDQAHAIEGLSDAENVAALKIAYDACVAAVKNADGDAGKSVAVAKPAAKP